MNIAPAELLLGIVRNFRYWRATLITSIACATAVMLTFSRTLSPKLGTHEPAVIHAGFSWAVVALGSVGCTIALAAWSLIISSLLLSVAQWVFIHIFWLLIPVRVLDEGVAEWKWWQRLTCPIDMGEMSSLQIRMRKVEPYADLRPEQKCFAYKRFLRDMERARVGSNVSDPRILEDIDRNYADFRTSLGLGIFLPWIAIEIINIFSGLEHLRLTSLFAIFVFCGASAWVTHKRALTVIVHIFSDPGISGSLEYLEINARAAMDDSACNRR